MKSDVKYRGQLVRTGGAPEDAASEMESIFEAITAELFKLDATDPFVGGSMAVGTVEIGVTVEGVDSAACLGTADAIIRCALHAAGVGTPEWDAGGREVTVEFEGYELLPA